VENVIRYLCCAALLTLSLGAAARQPGAGDDEGYNEFTIRASHYPADAPRFENYPATIYLGPLAPTHWRSSAESRLFRTQIKEWGKERPNFAGHYTLAKWGCGTDCTMFAFIDARTGKVYFDHIATNVAVNVHQDLLPGGDWHGSGALRFKADSRLLVLIGMPNEDPKLRGISFYEWTGQRLKLVRRVPVAWYPDKP